VHLSIPTWKKDLLFITLLFWHVIVKDKEEEKIFLPVEDKVEFDGKKVYQEDISMISAELATKLTYRDAVKEGKQFIKDFPFNLYYVELYDRYVRETVQMVLLPL